MEDSQEPEPFYVDDSQEEDREAAFGELPPESADAQLEQALKESAESFRREACRGLDGVAVHHNGSG